MTAITSREALNYVTASGTRETQERMVAKAIAQHPGMTASELDAILHLGCVSIRRRLSDMKKDGMALQGAPRRTKGSIRREMTWFPREQQGALPL